MSPSLSLSLSLTVSLTVSLTKFANVNDPLIVVFRSLRLLYKGEITGGIDGDSTCHAFMGVLFFVASPEEPRLVQLL